MSSNMQLIISCVKYETHDTIYDEVEEDEMYELKIIILDDKEWRNRDFEKKSIYVYDIKEQLVWMVYMKIN